MHATLYHPRGETAKPCVFLDRDGTINVDKNYLYKPEDWEWIAGAKEAILRANQAGFLVVVVSNQSGIARGLYTAKDVELLHQFVHHELQQIGAHIDAFYFCPHGPDDGCDCRKPSPKMLQHAAQQLNIDLQHSYMIGDKVIDVQAGINAGVKSILVRTGQGAEEAKKVKTETVIVEDLDAAMMVAKIA